MLYPDVPRLHVPIECACSMAVRMRECNRGTSGYTSRISWPQSLDISHCHPLFSLPPRPHAIKYSVHQRTGNNDWKKTNTADLKPREGDSRSRRDVMRLSNKRSPYLFGVATANRTKVTTPNKYGTEIIARMSDWENPNPRKAQPIVPSVRYKTICLTLKPTAALIYFLHQNCKKVSRSNKLQCSKKVFWIIRQNICSGVLNSRTYRNKWTPGKICSKTNSGTPILHYIYCSK